MKYNKTGKKIELGIFLIIVSLVFNSCATLMSGKYQRIKLESMPEGAQVYVNGEDINKTTPCNVRVKRKIAPTQNTQKNEYQFKFTKEWYQETIINDKASLNAWIIGNLWLYIVPVIVDFSSGAHLKYSKTIYANLKPSNNFENPIVQPELLVTNQITQNKTNNRSGYEFKPTADIDRDIPENKNENSTRFALIIGNEDYSSYQLDLSNEVDVQFARNDASAFREYALKTLGIPERNIVFLLDATSGQMHQAIAKINLIIKNTAGKADVVVYYAGHGLPDDNSHEPYLIPVDVSGKNLTAAIKLKDVLTKLTEYPAERVTFFIDACFSGGARNQGLVAARSVKIKPKESNLSGNIVVFAASSGEQTSLPYKQQQHGLFTYYLLKKIQETKGKVTYSELTNYLNEKVGIESVLSNDKEQTPQVSFSPDVEQIWKRWKLTE